MSGVGQNIDATLGAIEPAIHIMLQNFRRIGHFGLRSRSRRGPCDSADAQASACWR